MAGLASQSETVQGRPALLLSGRQQGSQQQLKSLKVKADSVTGLRQQLAL